MEQLCVTARNISHIVDGDEVVSLVEAILTVHCKWHKPDGPQTEYKTYRIWMNPAAARLLAENLADWADEAEAEANRLTLKSKPETKGK